MRRFRARWRLAAARSCSCAARSRRRARAPARARRRARRRAAAFARAARFASIYRIVFRPNAARRVLPVRVAASRAGRSARLRLLALHRGGRDGAARSNRSPSSPRVDRSPSTRRSRSASATYNPDPQLLARQLDSIRAQTRRDFTCIIHDDGSRLDRWAEIEMLGRTDARFRVFRAEHNRGFYRNFEAALALVPSSTPYVALCDQDDVWYPEKLARRLSALDANPRAQLVYSDMRIVRHDGAVARRPTGSAAQQLHAISTRCCSPTPSPAPPRSSAARCSSGAALSARAGTVVPRSLAGLRRLRRRRHRLRRSPALRLHATWKQCHRPLGFGPLTVGGALWRHARNTVEMLVKPPMVLGNLWSCCLLSLRLSAHAPHGRDALLRFPDAPTRSANARAVRRSTARAATLIFTRHRRCCAAVTRRTWREFKLGMGLLLHKVLVRSLRSSPSSSIGQAAAIAEAPRMGGRVAFLDA